MADGDDGPVAGPAEPWAALLPGLDPTAMGWQERDWYLAPDLRSALFDRSGNVGPTVWWDGRVVGGWAQRASGEVVWRLLDTDGVGREARDGDLGGGRAVGGLAGLDPDHSAVSDAVGAGVGGGVSFSPPSAPARPVPGGCAPRPSLSA